MNDLWPVLYALSGFAVALLFSWRRAWRLLAPALRYVVLPAMRFKRDLLDARGRVSELELLVTRLAARLDRAEREWEKRDVEQAAAINELRRSFDGARRDIRDLGQRVDDSLQSVGRRIDEFLMAFAVAFPAVADHVKWKRAIAADDAALADILHPERRP